LGPILAAKVIAGAGIVGAIGALVRWVVHT